MLRVESKESLQLPNSSPCDRDIKRAASVNNEQPFPAVCSSLKERSASSYGRHNLIPVDNLLTWGSLKIGGALMSLQGAHPNHSICVAIIAI